MQYSLPRLRATAIEENGVYFCTGVPVTFMAIHNTKGAKFPTQGALDRFQQRIEPKGMYLLHHTGESIPPGWIQFPLTFQSPLVIVFSATGLYDDTSWKYVLACEFRATGKRLTKRLLREGYDGIVTVELPKGRMEAYTAEIVNLKLTEWEIVD